MEKSKRLMDSTMSSSVYNKARKTYLEQSGKIDCSWCRYHNNENYRGKHYGSTYWTYEKPESIRMPSWKLSCKNRKQWEQREFVHIKTSEMPGSRWAREMHRIDVVFPRNRNK